MFFFFLLFGDCGRNFRVPTPFLLANPVCAIPAPYCLFSSFKLYRFFRAAQSTALCVIFGSPHCLLLFAEFARFFVFFS